MNGRSRAPAVVAGPAVDADGCSVLAAKTMPTILRSVCLFLLGSLLIGQDKPLVKDEDEVSKVAARDPYTDGDEAAKKAAGVVSHAPFPWADGHRTTDIDKVLGENRILWLETAHFRFAFTLRSATWPDESDARKALQDEVKALKKKLPKVPEKPKRLDPWLRLHLYAQRCEDAYARFHALLGTRDADFGAGQQFLGLPDKYLVMVFQKRSDMARYMDKFCSQKADDSLRYFHDKTRQPVLCVAVEAFEGLDEPGIHGHVLHGVWHLLLGGHGGYPFEMPPWLADGIAHWHTHTLPGDFLNVQIKDDEAVADDKRNEWDIKVRRRVQHETLMIPFATMAQWSDPAGMGYHGVIQSWSRIDYLMRLDPKLVGKVLRELKATPPADDYASATASARTQASELVLKALGCDAATFDRRWREWVLKTYPKR